jgi:hypothetical protein
LKAFELSPLLIVNKLNANSLPRETYIKSLTMNTTQEVDSFVAAELKEYKAKIYTEYLSKTLTKDNLLKLLSLQGEKG